MNSWYLVHLKLFLLYNELISSDETKTNKKSKKGGETLGCHGHFSSSIKRTFNYRKDKI